MKSHPTPPEHEGEPLEIEQRRSIGFVANRKARAGGVPRAGVLGFALMASRAVLYNATLIGMTSIMTTADATA
jgi:hypothetical protein